MKLLVAVLMVLMSAFSSKVEEEYNTYLSNINSAYDSYIIAVTENENYTVAVVQGMCNNNLSYGVFLCAYDNDAYVIKVFIGDKEYSLPTNSRHDTMVYAVNMPTKPTKVCVYDNDKGNSTVRWEMELSIKSIEDLNNSANVYHGMNQGIQVSTMSRKYNFKTIAIFAVAILLLIAVVGVVVIIFMKKNKKGIFSENKEDNTVVFFGNDAINIKDEEVNTSEEIKEDNNFEDFEVKEVYEKKYYFDDDEENYIDIKPLLIDAGYKTEYKDMTEAEKNEVMIYLMTLRHNGKITEAQYKKESANLWKKY